MILCVSNVKFLFQNLYFNNDLLILPSYINWIGQKKQAAETVNAAMFWGLSSKPFIGMAVGLF